MIYAVTGPDAFLVRARLRQLLTQYDSDGLNTSTFDAKPGNVDEIATALGTPGFFGGARVIVVNDLMTLASKGVASDDESDGPAGKAAVNWSHLWTVLRPENVAIFVDRDLRGVPAAVKKALPGDATVTVCEPPRGNALIGWIRTRAGDAGSRIETTEARALAELICPVTWANPPSNPAYDRPPDLDRFAGEVDKLAAAAAPGPITREVIAEMSAAGDEDRLFQLIDAVMSGSERATFANLVNVASDDESPRVTAQLSQQAELMAVLASARGVDPVEAGRAIGLANPNRMLGVGKSMRGLTHGPRPVVRAALETDRQMKTGLLRNPTDALYALVDRLLTERRETPEGGT